MLDSLLDIILSRIIFPIFVNKHYILIMKKSTYIILGVIIAIITYLSFSEYTKSKERKELNELLKRQETEALFKSRLYGDSVIYWLGELNLEPNDSDYLEAAKEYEFNRKSTESDFILYEAYMKKIQRMISKKTDFQAEESYKSLVKNRTQFEEVSKKVSAIKAYTNSNLDYIEYCDSIKTVIRLKNYIYE